ncbi:MAG: TonB family protein [candidate division KSB1 bacterium]|nr:TonB family protein [candidate division KSB1 bacterium]
MEPNTLNKLPKEFRKGIFESLDKRYYSILLFSLIFHVVAVVILFHIRPRTIDSGAISKIQKQFVDLLVEKTPESVARGEKSVWQAMDAKSLAELNRWIETLVKGAIKDTEVIPDMTAMSKESVSQRVRETMVPSAESREAMRKGAASARGEKRKAEYERLNSVGLLGVITSGSGVINYEYVADILETAAKNSEHLDRVLAKLSALRVPRYTSRLIFDASETALKGGRVHQGNQEDFYKTVETLAPAKATEMAKNVDYEKMPSALAGLNRQATDGKARNPKDVSQVIMSHNKAIQDCYRQALKLRPGLRGKITVRFTVDYEGRVKSAEIIESTLNDPEIETCILQRIRRWNDFGYCDPSFGDATYRQVYSFGI